MFHLLLDNSHRSPLPLKGKPPITPVASKSLRAGLPFRGRGRVEQKENPFFPLFQTQIPKFYQ